MDLGRWGSRENLGGAGEGKALYFPVVYEKTICSNKIFD